MTSWWPKGGEKRSFNVRIYEEDYKELCAWVLKKPNIETGGDLFGLWADKHTAVIQLVLGPGKSCSRTTVSFYQDIDYLRRVGSYLTENEGVCHIGEWHSHHQLGLARPSGGDENTVWNNMPTYNLKRFVIFIANIRSSKQSYNVNVGCFLFEIDDQGKHMDVLPGTFTILQKNSPFSWKMEVSAERMKGAEKDDESKIAVKELKMEVKEGEKRPSVTYLKPTPAAHASERKRGNRGNHSQPANQNKSNDEESSVDSKKRKMNTKERSPDKTSENGKPEGSPPCEDLENLTINNEPQKEKSEEAMEQEKEEKQPEKKSQEEFNDEFEEQHDGEQGKSQGKKAGNFKENDEAGPPQADQGKTENGGKSRPLPILNETKPEAKLTQKQKYEGEDVNKVTTNDEQPEEKSDEVMKEQEEMERQEKKNQEEVRRDEQRDKEKGKSQGRKGETPEKDKEDGSSQAEQEKAEIKSKPRPLPPKPKTEATPKPEAKLTQKQIYEGEDEDVNKVTINDEQPEEKSEEVTKEQEEMEQQEKKNQEEVRRDEQRDKEKGKSQGRKGETPEKDKENGSSHAEQEKVEKKNTQRPPPPKPKTEATPGGKTPKKKKQEKETTQTRAGQSGAKKAGSSQTVSKKSPKKQK